MPTAVAFIASKQTSKQIKSLHLGAQTTALACTTGDVTHAQKHAVNARRPG